jgi:hypothetical protein
VRRCSRSRSVLSRVIPNTTPSVYWANTKGTCVGSCEERTKSVRRYREANTEAEGILAAFWRKALSDIGEMSGVLRRFPGRSDGEGPEKRLASAGQAHIPQLAAVHGFATSRTLQAVRPQRNMSCVAASPALAGTDRGGDRPSGHDGEPKEARKGAVFATGIRAHQHGRKPVAAQSGGPGPGRRPRSARRILARQPDEEAKPDPTTEFGP